MAGVLVEVLLQRLATLALDKFVEEMKLVSEVEKEIKDLIKKLRAIQAVLEDAEQRQVTDDSVKLWLDELKDVSFDMDDVIDEWITRVEKHLLEKQEKQQKKVEKHQLEKQEKQQKKARFPWHVTIGGQKETSIEDHHFRHDLAELRGQRLQDLTGDHDCQELKRLETAQVRHVLKALKEGMWVLKAASFEDLPETLQALFCSKFHWLDSPRQDAPQKKIAQTYIYRSL